MLSNGASRSTKIFGSACLQVKESSGEEKRENVRVNAVDSFEIPGSRCNANFILKWYKDARHTATLNVTALKGVTQSYTAAKAGQFVPIIAFECRGMEPVTWHPEVCLPSSREGSDMCHHVVIRNIFIALCLIPVRAVLVHSILSCNMICHGP